MKQIGIILGLFTISNIAAAQVAVPHFEGKMLVAVSDADMLPSAYVDGMLGPAAGEDMLSVIRLDRPSGSYQATSIPVSNSVTGPPASVAVTPDGRYAVVIETRGPRPDAGATMLSQLRIGYEIALIDLRDPERPRVVERLNGLASPSSVSINPSGSLIAISYPGGSAAQPSPPLILYRLVNGHLSAPITPPVPDWIPGHSMIDTAFHPHDRVLAVLDVTSPAISFVRYADRPDGGIDLVKWGNRVPVDQDPYLVRFTSDGRHVLTNGTYAAFGFNLDPNDGVHGTVTSIRVAASFDAEGSPQHRFISRANVGIIPEGMSISPNDRFVVTANLEHSAPRPGQPNMARYATMSLLRLDPASGRLRHTRDVAFNGALPEMALFDSASRFIAVTVFSRFDQPLAKGAIELWRIESDPFDPDSVELVKTADSIPYNVDLTRLPSSDSLMSIGLLQVTGPL